MTSCLTVLQMSFKKYYSEFRIFESDKKGKKGGKFKILQELVSVIGITICKKCGARTKYKKTDEMGAEGYTLGYTICPKCGNMQVWTSGLDSGSGGFGP